MDFLKEKQDIIAWLNEHHVQNYDLVVDEQHGYVVNVQGDVYLYQRQLKQIPVKFNQVSGNFHCHHNQLTILEFAPLQVGGDFDCDSNQLNSLEFAPKQVGGDFYCHHNQLSTLEFCPEQVGGRFYCHGNAALKDTQSLTDFKAIYQLHREAVIEKNYTQLTQSLAVVDPISLENNKVKVKL